MTEQTQSTMSPLNVAGRLVEWDEIVVRVRGDRLVKIVMTEMARQRLPIEQLRMEFLDSHLRVEGRARKIFPLPFRLSLHRIEVRDATVRVPLEELRVFGLPVPSFLAWIFEGNVWQDTVSLDAREPAVVIRMDRFLPEFMDVDVREIGLIEGGLRVRLGPGAADLPVQGGEQ